TLPLDLDDLLAQDPGGAVASIDSATSVGHVHLKVSDVPRAAAFYRDVLGFEEQATMPSAAFLSAGGYHHHVGLNSWQSAGAAPAPDNAPGLREVRVELGDDAAVRELERGLREGSDGDVIEEGANGGLSVRDPDGQLLTFGHR
ncbi:MAG TPA: VOC family protein, partial [Solirubrobacteraceae bacterium]